MPPRCEPLGKPRLWGELPPCGHWVRPGRGVTSRGNRFVRKTVRSIRHAHAPGPRVTLGTRHLPIPAVISLSLYPCRCIPDVPDIAAVICRLILELDLYPQGAFQGRLEIMKIFGVHRLQVCKG